MRNLIKSLHHVTATVHDAQEDLDFYTGLLGLRLLKKTVNFDNPGVYHFYYGNAQGQPGTLMTTFPYKGKGVRIGVKGTGQVITTSFSVPAGSLDFWRERLARHGVAVREAGERLAEQVITFDDPSGLVLELVASGGDHRTPWTTEDLPAPHAIRGLHSVTLVIKAPGPTRQLLENVLGFDVLGEEAGRTRFGVGGGGGGKQLDVLHLPETAAGVNGIGTVHHVALAVSTEAEQGSLREELVRLGYAVTPVRDRQYFQSIYFREPGGVLLEVATLGPGFLVDEEEAVLGRGLMLPPWEEGNRAVIEAALPRVHTRLPGAPTALSREAP